MKNNNGRDTALTIDLNKNGNNLIILLDLEFFAIVLVFLGNFCTFLALCN